MVQNYHYFDGSSEMVTIFNVITLDIHHYRMLVLLLLNYPLTILFVHLTHFLGLGMGKRHVLSFMLGSGYLLWILPKHVYFLFLGYSVFIYLLAKFAAERVNPLIVMFFTLCQIFYHDVMVGREGLGAILAAVKMVFLIRWSYFYGSARDKEVTLKAGSHFPSLLAYLGFMFFYPLILTGPAYRFKEYEILMTNSFVKPGKAQYVDALGKLLKSLFCAAVWVKIGEYLPATYFLSDEFLWQTTFLKKLGLLFIFRNGQEAMYYFCWTIVEGPIAIFSDSPTSQGYFKNMSGIFQGAFCINAFQFISNWNMRTQEWLRKEVYDRLKRTGAIPGVLVGLITFATSAVWHGVQPGFYVSFLCLFMDRNIARLFHKYLRPWFAGKKVAKFLLPFLTLVEWFVMQSLFSIYTFPINSPDFKGSLGLFQSFSYIVPVVLVLATLIVAILDHGPRGKEGKQD